MARRLSFGMRGTGEHSGRSTVRSSSMDPNAKKKIAASAAWREARELVWAHRRRLALGLGLMLIGRLAGLVLPFSPKWLIDEVIARERTDLLVPLALVAGAATIVQAVTSFAL